MTARERAQWSSGQLPPAFCFSEELEDYLRPFDNPVLHWCQQGAGRPHRYRLALLLTATTTVEAGVLLTYVFYGAGYYQAACVWNMHVFVLSLISQLPKRFVWRSRPYMQQRAVALRQDRTSSFPSRGVTCALVYPVALGRAFLGRYLSSKLATRSPWFFTLYSLAFAFAAATAWARVHLGVHFPSDAFAGFLQGTLVLMLVQPRIYQYCLGARSFWVSLGVARCQLDGLRLACMSAFGVGMLAIAELPKLQLWGKASYIFGALWGMIALRMSGLCFASPQLPWRARIGGALAGASSASALVLVGIRLVRRRRNPHDVSGGVPAILGSIIVTQALPFLIIYGLSFAYLWLAPRILAKLGQTQ
ncbi:hypothetical protein CCYA_CCYA12G3290 [Cyanidiococcus yangmingshanensis]|nr:hypothetical protein CCYA_CCYA12G3290 [Cyanidiococcus yangmingshanensis]